MKLPTNDGIGCDLCGMTCRHDFTYYSYDFHHVEVYNNSRPDLQSILSSPIIFSIDVCPACFDGHRKTIIANYNKILSPKRRTVTGTHCDLTGQKLVGTYEFYYAEVTKVVVRTAGGRPAVATDKRHVEMSVCEDTYKKLTASAGTVRKVAGQWSTNS